MSLTIRILLTVAVSSGFIAITTATNYPCGTPPKERSIIEVSQIPQTADQRGTYTKRTHSGKCIPITNTRVPLALQLDSATPPGSYQLRGFSTTCHDRPRTQSISANFSGPIIVNSRKQICSFKIGNYKVQHPVKKIDVIFLGETSKGSTPFYGITLATDACQNLCAASSWAKYSEKVRILDNKTGKATSNYVTIYSDPGCNSDSVLHKKVRHGANLVDLTLEDPGKLVRSFVVLKDGREVK